MRVGLQFYDLLYNTNATKVWRTLVGTKFPTFT